tara:strand:+ start:99 stop:1535 length:1437 start_codon:yes stop_codon:yes gene_type:complete
LDTGIFHCVQHFSIEKSADQDLIVSTSFGRDGARKKTLNLDIFGSFAEGSSTVEGNFKLLSHKISSGTQSVSANQVFANIIHEPSLATKLFLNNGILETSSVIYDPISPKQVLHKSDNKFNQKIVVTDLEFTSNEIKDAKLNITFHYSNNEQNPLTINDVGWKEWNKLVNANRSLFSYPDWNIKLVENANMPKSLFGQSAEGFDEILSVDRFGIIEKIELKDFEWSRPEFGINEDKTALTISVDYPIDLSEYRIDSDRKLTLEIDGFNNSFVDDIRKFVKARIWRIEETKNVTLELGENRFRIEMLRNTTELTVSKSSIEANTAPIQVRLFGQWNPLKNEPKKEPESEPPAPAITPITSTISPIKGISGFDGFGGFGGFGGFTPAFQEPESSNQSPSDSQVPVESGCENQEASKGPIWVGGGKPLSGMVVDKGSPKVKIGKSVSQIKKEGRKSRREMRRQRKQERKDKKRKNRKGGEK